MVLHRQYIADSKYELVSRSIHVWGAFRFVYLSRVCAFVFFYFGRDG